MASRFIYNDKANLGPFVFPAYMLSPRRLGIYFTLTSDYYTLSSIKVKFANYGNPSGPLTVSVYQATSFIPTGSILTSGEITQDEIADYSGPGWVTPYTGIGALHEITFNSIILSPGQPYIVTIAITQADVGVNTTALMLSSPPISNSGPGSNVGMSVFNGSTWSDWTVSEPIFELWGTIYIPRDPERPDTDLVTFPPTRPDDYDPDLFWTPDPTPYQPPTWQEPGQPYQATGGGRWGQNLIVVGKDLIYYEPHEGV